MSVLKIETQTPAMISEGLPYVPLRDVCIPKTGVRNPGAQPEDTFQYVDISAVDNITKRITSPQTLLGKNAPSRARNIIRENDVIVATTRPNLNAVARVPRELNNEICSTGFCVLRPGENLLPEYLFLFVQSRVFVDALADLVKGALYPAVNDFQVLDQRIPLPKIHDQKLIAHSLSSALATVEKARIASKERLAAAQTLQAAYLREVFEGEAAQGWKRQLLGDLCTIVRGSSPRPKGDTRYYGGDVPRLMVEDCTRDGMFVKPRIDFLTQLGATMSRPMMANDVVMVVSGNPGLPAILAVDCCIHDGFVGLRNISKDVDRTFLYHYLKFHHARTDIEATGAIFRNLTTTQVGNVPIDLPSLDEQHRLATQLTKRLAAVEQLTAAVRGELEVVEALPGLLLRETFGHRE